MLRLHFKRYEKPSFVPVMIYKLCRSPWPWHAAFLFDDSQSGTIEIPTHFLVLSRLWPGSTKGDNVEMSLLSSGFCSRDLAYRRCSSHVLDSLGNPSQLSQGSSSFGLGGSIRSHGGRELGKVGQKWERRGWFLCAEWIRQRMMGRWSTSADVAKVEKGRSVSKGLQCLLKEKKSSSHVRSLRRKAKFGRGFHRQLLPHFSMEL